MSVCAVVAVNGTASHAFGGISRPLLVQRHPPESLSVPGQDGSAGGGTSTLGVQAVCRSSFLGVFGESRKLVPLEAEAIIGSAETEVSIDHER
jgi:hypothetical protein